MPKEALLIRTLVELADNLVDDFSMWSSCCHCSRPAAHAYEPNDFGVDNSILERTGPG